MNTTALENMISAVKVTRSIAQEMGSNFEEYIEELAKLITSDLIHNKFSSSVRKEATRMCSSLIFCCSNNIQRVELLKMFMPHIAQ